MTNHKFTRLTFDTLAFSKELQSAGIPIEHADAIASAEAKIHETTLEQLVTKQDLALAVNSLESKLTLRFGGMLVAAVVILGILIKVL